MKRVLWSSLALAFISTASAQYKPVREYAGTTFFDAWDFYGFYDNTTWGNVTYQDRTNATSKNLAFVNSAGNAIVKVDNTTNVADGPLVYRDSIRITSHDTYGVGTLIILDALHIPYGCSVWPSFWTLGVGEEWPGAGEIDIVESINLMSNNQVALHTTPGCFLKSNGSSNPGMSGGILNDDCSQGKGCIVSEKKPNSFGQGFAQAGGGVFAVQFDVSGVYIWFFSRPDIPANIQSATSTSSVDPSTWGMPTAAYPAAGCNITEFFGPQQLVLLTTLCGDWAGVDSIYASTCHTTPTGKCFADNIIGPGSPKYDNAYWEIKYIRAYLVDGAVASSTVTTSTASKPSTIGGANGQLTTTITVPGTTTTPGGSTQTSSSAAVGSSPRFTAQGWAIFLTAGMVMLGWACIVF